MASSSRQPQEHERTTFLFFSFGYLNDCCLKNIDETVSVHSIVITTGIIYPVALC